MALDNVDFELKKGEVMALVGQNGAGKSTLIKILGGAIPPDRGEIFLEGKRVSIKNPKDAYDLGFSFIFQEEGLLNGFTGLENIFIGMPYPKKGIKIDWKRLYNAGEKLKKKFEIDVNLEIPVERLSPLERKKVEILKALARSPKIFVLDEPTATLTEEEVNHLFKIINMLKNLNIGIIYISHFLDEIFCIADRVTILKDGKKVGTFPIDTLTREDIINYEVGSTLRVEKKKSVSSDMSKKVLNIEDLSTSDGLHHITFSLYRGEILGVFGLGGQGKTRLAMALSGNSRIISGTMMIKNRVVSIKSPIDALSYGIVMVPQERAKYGIIESFSIAWNTTLPILKSIRKIPALPIIDTEKEREKTEYIIKNLEIKAKGPNIPTKELSGGNKQKVVIGKWLLKNPEIFIFDEPTQGLDVLAREEVHSLILKFSSEGTSQIVISSDIDELIKISHRIMIMRSGAIEKIVDTQEIVGKDVLSIAYGGNYENS